MTDPVAIRCAATIEALLKSDFVAAIAHLRWLDARAGKWRYRHRNLNAIARIEEVFREIYRRDPWPNDWPLHVVHQWENEVGYHVHRLGVAALVDDLHQAQAAGLKPRTLIYFLRSHDEHRREQSSRWEMLLYARMEAEWQETKRHETEEAKEAARRLGVKVEKPVAAWVVEARETLRRIKTKASPTQEELREVAKIEGIMSRMGIRPCS